MNPGRTSIPRTAKACGGFSGEYGRNSSGIVVDLVLLCCVVLGGTDVQTVTLEVHAQEAVRISTSIDTSADAGSDNSIDTDIDASTNTNTETDSIDTSVSGYGATRSCTMASSSISGTTSSSAAMPAYVYGTLLADSRICQVLAAEPRSEDAAASPDYHYMYVHMHRGLDHGKLHEG